MQSGQGLRGELEVQESGCQSWSERYFNGGDALQLPFGAVHVVQKRGAQLCQTAGALQQWLPGCRS